MRAIAITAFGGPEVLQFTEVPQPPPAPGQVLIRVAYKGVNFAEIMGSRGDFHALGAGDGTRTRDSLLGRQGVTKSPLVCHELALLGRVDDTFQM